MSDQKAKTTHESRTGQVPRIVIEEMLARREASRQARIDSSTDASSVTGVMRLPLAVEAADESAERDSDRPRQDS